MADSPSSNSVAERYIVPLGREKGGYLDLLGLPPDATEAEVAARGTEYRAAIEKEFRAGRVEWNKRFKAGEIDQETKDAEVAKLEAVKNDKMTECGALNAKYEAMLAERRKLANAGRRRDEAVFGDLGTGIAGGIEGLWKRLEGLLPVSQVSDEFAAAVWRRCTEGKASAELPSQKWDGSTPADLSVIMDLWLERTLGGLAAADAAWRSFESTNQQAWDWIVEQWIEEARKSSSPAPAMTGAAPPWEFPAVAQWPSLYVDHLPPGEKEERVKPSVPEKGDDEFDAEEFLEWMRSNAAAGKSGAALDMAEFAKWKAQRRKK